MWSEIDESKETQKCRIKLTKCRCDPTAITAEESKSNLKLHSANFFVSEHEKKTVGLIFSEANF